MTTRPHVLRDCWCGADHSKSPEVAGEELDELISSGWHPAPSELNHKGAKDHDRAIRLFISAYWDHRYTLHGRHVIRKALELRRA